MLHLEDYQPIGIYSPEDGINVVAHNYILGFPDADPIVFLAVDTYCDEAQVFGVFSE